jgi:hypothetical protein
MALKKRFINALPKHIDFCCRAYLLVTLELTLMRIIPAQCVATSDKPILGAKNGLSWTARKGTAHYLVKYVLKLSKGRPNGHGRLRLIVTSRCGQVFLFHFGWLQCPFEAKPADHSEGSAGRGFALKSPTNQLIAVAPFCHCDVAFF